LHTADEVAEAEAPVAAQDLVDQVNQPTGRVLKEHFLNGSQMNN